MKLKSSRNINCLLIGKLVFRIGMVGVNYSFSSVTQLSDFCFARLPAQGWLSADKTPIHPTKLYLETLQAHKANNNDDAFLHFQALKLTSIGEMLTCKRCIEATLSSMFGYGVCLRPHAPFSSMSPFVQSSLSNGLRTLSPRSILEEDKITNLFDLKPTSCLPLHR